MTYRHKNTGTVYVKVDTTHPKLWVVTTKNQATYIVKSENIEEIDQPTNKTGAEK